MSAPPSPATEPAPVTRSPWSTAQGVAFDLALTLAGLAVVLVMGLNGIDTLSVVLSLLEIVPLLLRRIRPTLSFTLVSLVMSAQVFLKDVPIWGQVAMPVALYAMAAYAPRRHARIALAVGLVAGIVGPVSWWRAYGTGSNYPTLFVTTELLVITPWVIGTLLRIRRAYVAELIDRGHRLAREAEQRAELAASDERARIAREMHDVVAHGLSMMIVQADGASYVVHRDPERASEAMAAISATGRESLAEMRRLLGLLRSEDDPGPGHRPQPGLADLGYLVEQSRASGMHLTASVVEPAHPVMAGVGLTVYRVVQEALTNVRKHAGPGPQVQLSVRPDGRALVVEVCDDGRGPGVHRDVDGGGHGLAGMRERVALHGGSLHTGPRVGGGFEVRAEIPLADVAPT